MMMMMIMQLQNACCLLENIVQQDLRLQRFAVVCIKIAEVIQVMELN